MNIRRPRLRSNVLILVFAWLVALAPFHGSNLSAKEAYVIQMSEDWTIEGDLPKHALLLSLQGLVNRESPQLYFEYMPSWPWKITKPLKEFYERRHGFAFNPLDTPTDALKRFAEAAKGYVVWDKKERTSLIVAFTIAGVEDLVIVSEELIPLVEKFGLREKVDLRGVFTGQPDHEIFQWAYDRYWERCSRDLVIWMGGAHGKRMEAGMADWGIYRRAFFTDSSANPNHPEELAFTHRILSEQNPQSFVMGWHSYAKDTEGQMTTLTSSYGLRMEGLNTLPNLSFNNQIPFTDDFKFVNNHNVEADEIVEPEEKVYLSLVQTDSIGIGAWTKPGRGKIPYAWQVSMSWMDIAPASLQFFFEGAMPNDYFIAGLSGPSYMYPKPIPTDAFPTLMNEAKRQMEILDLRVMETMDYSEGNRHVGNTELTKEVADRYYENFPDVIGFINGYGSARTFDLRDDRPLISYEYYLGLRRPEEEAVADIEELISLNQKRPYFMLIHVRESKSIEKTVSILNGVSEPIEVVPLDVFLKMASRAKTYRTRYQQSSDPIVPNPF